MSKLAESLELGWDLMRRGLGPSDAVAECMLLVESGADTEMVLRAAVAYGFVNGVNTTRERS